MRKAISLSAPHHVPRRAKCLTHEVSEPNEKFADESRTLSQWRDLPAYALLGEPGAGKTASMEAECAAVGGRTVSAVHIGEGIEPHATSDEIVFIDALDQATASKSPQTEDVVAAVVRWLIASGKPRFRLSCRDADWHGSGNAERINFAAPNGEFAILQLEPLTDEDILHVLRNQAQRVANAESFMAQARQHGVYEMLRNPQLLELMISAVGAEGEKWPSTRQQVYETACTEIVKEKSEEHAKKTALEPGDTPQLLNACGLLFALQLLSGKEAVSTDGSHEVHALNLNDIDPVPGLESSLVKRAAKSLFFSASEGRAAYRHRTIAEFLAGKAVADLVQSKAVPLSRVLALACGFDGKPVHATRGFLGWLATHLNVPEREELLRLDPVGFVLNGDAACLTHEQRLLVLSELAKTADQNRSLGTWSQSQHPFGALATVEMEKVLKQELSRPDRSMAHQSYLLYLLEAVKHASQGMPKLAVALKAWVEDEAAQVELRKRAFDAWQRHCPVGQQESTVLRWLDEVAEGRLTDPQHAVLGCLLPLVYPKLKGPQVLRFLDPHLSTGHSIRYWLFWTKHFLDHNQLADMLPGLADGWLIHFAGANTHEASRQHKELAGRLLLATLNHCGDSARVERLWAWLDIGLDEHHTETGRDPSQPAIAAWLEQRPSLMKALIAHAYQLTANEKQSSKNYWQAQTRLRGAKVPRDWLLWQMSLASNSKDYSFVQWVTHAAAAAALEPKPELEAPNLDELVAWATALTPIHPTTLRDLELYGLAQPIDHHAGRLYQSRKRHEAEREVEKTNRRKNLLDALAQTPIPPAALQAIAKAYEGHFSDLDAQAPPAKVAALLGGSLEEAEAALLKVDETLRRADWPTPQEILDLHFKGQQHILARPALVAAKRAHAADPQALHCWTETRQQQLVAFWLTSGVWAEPQWYRTLKVERSQLVAEVFVPYAQAKLRLSEPQHIVGVDDLCRTDGPVELARLVVPLLISGFPIRAKKQARDALIRYIVPALRHVPGPEADSLVRKRLTLKSLDVGQRLVWTVALLRFDSGAAEELHNMVAGDEKLASMLFEILHLGPHRLFHGAEHWSPHALAGLITALAPLAPFPTPKTQGEVYEVDARSDVIDTLLRQLSQDHSEEATQVMEQLIGSGVLGARTDSGRYHQLVQQGLRRQASFRLPKPEEVAQVLANANPTNPADLAALLVDQLREVGKEARGSDTFLLTHFWAAKEQPKEENDCRDALLVQLRARLKPKPIQLVPEALAAAQKRMDFKAVCRDHAGNQVALPVEVKKDNHVKVWKAWENQLDKLYANDPAANGFGLYLVLWFGVGTKREPGIAGPAPKSAHDMQVRLKARIPKEDQHRLSVCVLDLSWPAGAKHKAMRELG